ncbi:MAG: hypothetical protein KDE27_32775 [Planctomycetes bacterium]|nr:hypothetical protein [Planctomycetota bacterium]
MLHFTRVLFAAALAACSHGGGGGSFSFTSTPATSTAIRSSWQYQATTGNAPGAVTYSLLQGPVGATMSSDGLLSWTPTYADLGTHTLIVRATAANTAIDQSLALRVHQGLQMGVGLSPRGHTGSSTTPDYEAHLDPDSPHGRARGFHTAWRDSVANGGQIPPLLTVGMSFASTYGIEPGYVIGWADGNGAPDLTSDSNPSDNSWNNAETRSEFLAMVTAFAAAATPEHLFLGNEVNAYYNTHSQPEWDAWISEYEACYDAIATVSPDTQVGMVFQLEMLKGLGGNTGWSWAAQWSLVDALVASGRVDVIGFTSYPYLHYDLRTDVPSGYYDEIAAHWTGPVAFTEIGWLATAHPPYPGDETDQALFVGDFFAATANLDLAYVAWLFLHDWDGQASTIAFADIGLRNNDGSVIRMADMAWRVEVALRQR